MHAAHLLYPEQVEPVVVGDHVDREAEVAIPPAPPNAVEVRLRVPGKVEVDDDVDRQDVDSSGEQV